MSGISINLDVRAHFDGALLKEAGKAAGDLGRNIERGARDAGETVSRAVGEAGQAVGDVATNYVDERGKRASGVMDKLSQGNIVDAALDVFQAFSPGGRISDGAKALGLVKNDVDKYMLSGVVNALLLGPLNPATIGDAEDFLKTQFPQIKKTLKELSTLGQSERGTAGRCARSHEVQSPKASYKFARRHRVRGYAQSRHQVEVNVDFKMIRGGKRFKVCIRNRNDFAGFSGPFGRDLPELRNFIRRELGRVQDQVPAPRSTRSSSPATGKGHAAAPGDEKKVKDQSAYEQIFNDPTMSFEDKLFYFMALVAKKNEDKVERMMKKYDEFTKRQKEKEKAKKAIGKISGATTMVGTVALTAMGVPPPFSSMIAGMLGQGVSEGAEMVTEVAEEAKDLSKEDGDTTKLSKKEKGWSDQRWMMELQRLQEQMKKMYTMLSNTMKATHDTQMTAVRNMR